MCGSGSGIGSGSGSDRTGKNVASGTGSVFPILGIVALSRRCNLQEGLTVSTANIDRCHSSTKPHLCMHDRDHSVTRSILLIKERLLARRIYERRR